MSSLFMLDTNMVSYIARGRSAAARARLLGSKENEIACISIVTEAEIRYGLAKRPEAVTLRALMDKFLASIRILSWGRNEAEAYGAIRAKLEAAGTTLGNMDMMIAAHAVAAGATLVTNDKAFGQVEILSAIVNWAIDLNG